MAGCGSEDANTSGGGGQNQIETKAEKPDEAKANNPDESNRSASANATIPDGFPKEIPIIEDPFSLVAMSSDKAITVSYEVKKTFKEVLDVYKNYFKSAGYTDMQETVVDDSYIGIGVLSGKQLIVMLSVTNPDEPDVTGVTLTQETPVK